MNTQLAFAFGMLTVVSIAMVIGIIVSLVKAYKLKSEVKDTISHIERVTENIDRRLDDIIRELEQRVDYTQTNLDNKVDDVYRHIDSRFDKFENRISGTKQEKQLLKS